MSKVCEKTDFNARIQSITLDDIEELRKANSISINQMIDKITYRLLDNGKVQLKTIIFADLDNIFASDCEILDNTYYVYIANDLIGLCQSCNKISDISFIETKTMEKDASDEIIILLAGILHSILPLKTIDFQVITKDHFATILSSLLENHGRRCLETIKPLEREPIRGEKISDSISRLSDKELIEMWRESISERSERKFCEENDIDRSYINKWKKGETLLDKETERLVKIWLTNDFMDAVDYIFENFERKWKRSLFEFCLRADIDFDRVNDLHSNYRVYNEGMRVLGEFVTEGKIVEDDRGIKDVKGPMIFVSDEENEYMDPDIVSLIVDKYENNNERIKREGNRINVILNIGFIYGLRMYEGFTKFYSDMNLAEIYYQMKLNSDMYSELHIVPKLLKKTTKMTEKAIKRLRETGNIGKHKKFTISIKS